MFCKLIVRVALLKGINSMPNLINNGVVIYKRKMLRMFQRAIILRINYPIAALCLIQLRQILCSCFTHFILLFHPPN